MMDKGDDNPLSLQEITEKSIRESVGFLEKGVTAMDAHTVFKMATIGGAKAVGMEDEIGSIEIGKKADLAILNLKDFHTYPSYGVDPISRIVYSATSADVETTLINGKIVMENGCLKTVNKRLVLDEANNSIRRLLSRASIKC